MFRPHDSLSDAINRRIVASEIEGGVYLRDLPGLTALSVDTVNRRYQVILEQDTEAGTVLICGHPKYCPVPVRVRLRGSNWGGSMLKTDYLGRGMRMEFHHPGYRRTIVTSRIVDIRVVD